MKIVLIACPQHGVTHPALSLAYLAATLRNRCHEVVVLDLSIQVFNELSENEKTPYWDLNRPDYWWNRDSLDNIIKKGRIDSWAEAITQLKPDIVGFSIYTTNLLTSSILAEKIKTKNSKIKIIFGGPFARRDNHVAESIMKHIYIDAVVVGEGENTIEEIVDHYEKNNKIGYCKGALIRINKEVIDCGIRLPIQDLDSIPFPDFSDSDFSIYREKIVPILASRGCPNNCVFCDEKPFWQNYRYRTAGNVILEIKQQISNYGIKMFKFNDLLLNEALSELEKFCDMLIKENIKIKWGGFITVKKMEKRLIVKMKDSGCCFVSVGIESASQDILNKFKSSVRIEIAEELLKLFAETGISTHTGWIVGFPNESFSSFKQSIDFIKKNKKYINLVAASFLTVPPGSLMSVRPSSFGIKQLIREREFIDTTTTPVIRKARFDYFNKHIAYCK
ncbi:B12-binding domain-containing radical SAM protein [Candidatus Pacearchaeota archaeon]|nr:B12-binding domain-containing radical SAM protein [Candidatus Pacearchaeota archaeon]